MIAQIINNVFRKNTKLFGSRGEDAAVRYLKKLGYRIIERNFRLRGGEIDIIAEDNGQIVFVEVKTRVSSSREFVMATINKEKQRKISKTALYFISKNRYTDYSGRFDVIFISGNTFCPDIEHIKDAFTLC